MPEPNEPKPDEVIIRVIIRLNSEMTGDFARLNVDSEDFIRKLEYKNTGRPENGLSILRLDQFPTLQGVWDYIGSKKPMGAASCQFSKILSMKLKYTISGEQNEHISLRCQDCDLAKFQDRACKPMGADSHESCSFFGPDPLNLARLFSLIEPVQKREISKRNRNP